MSKTAHIFCNGDLTRYKDLKTHIGNYDFVICANGGSKIAYQQHIVPNLVIGDLDSLTKELRSFLLKHRVPFRKHPPEKDETDTELAIMYALKYHFCPIILYGLLGSRLDHLTANLFLVAALTKKGVKIEIVENRQTITFIKNQMTLTGKIGDLLSLVPFSEDCKDVTTCGLQFSLKKETLPVGTTRGISNVFTQNMVTVTLKAGLLMIVHTSQS